MPDWITVGTVKDAKMLLEAQTHLWTCEVNLCEEHHMRMDRTREMRFSLNSDGKCSLKKRKKLLLVR